MIITSADLDKVRFLVERGDPLPPAVVGMQTIAFDAAFELACSIHDWRARDVKNGMQLFEQWAGRVPSLRQVADALQNRCNPARDDKTAFAARPLEWCSVQEKEHVAEDGFQLFLLRFKKSLEEHGFAKGLAAAFAAAFGEMADNVVQHAALKSTFGLAGFYVVQGAAMFAVADVGQGILASLRQSDAWSQLTESTDALTKAIQEGATSRRDANYGGGFSTVHRSLASYNGLLRFRTSDALLTLSGRTDPRKARLGRVSRTPGFQLSVQCSLTDAKRDFLLAHFNE